MQILPDGRVQIQNKKTGAVKIVTPDQLPQYGINTDAYTAQKMLIDEQKNKANQAVLAGVPLDDNALAAGADLSVIQQAQQQKAQQQKQPLLDAVDMLLKENTKPITGNMQISEGMLSALNPQNIFDALTGNKAQTTKNKYDQLKAMLSLGNVEKLKGQGSVTEAERKMLAEAASSLGRNMSDTDFRKTLEAIQTSLGGKTSSSSLDTIDEELIKKYKGK